MDFPEELANPEVIGALVQHSHDDEVIGLRIEACLNVGEPSSWSDFLRSSGLVERETLNHVARSGACQFSAVADQLFRSRPVTEAFRPDVYLRLLALHCVSHNQKSFQDFMLHAAPVTRQQRQRGGGGVDMDEYARRMTSKRCDGDHITLQALCDVLKVNINVVKWTKDDGWYGGSADVGRHPRRSVFVADTLRPRAVPFLDERSRALRVDRRTLWLSLHGEAHFRSLRVREPVTEEEVHQARQRARLLNHSSPSSSSSPLATRSLSPRHPPAVAATTLKGTAGASAGGATSCGSGIARSADSAVGQEDDAGEAVPRGMSGAEGATSSARSISDAETLSNGLGPISRAGSGYSSGASAVIGDPSRNTPSSGRPPAASTGTAVAALGANESLDGYGCGDDDGSVSSAIPPSTTARPLYGDRPLTSPGATVSAAGVPSQGSTGDRGSGRRAAGHNLAMNSTASDERDVANPAGTIGGGRGEGDTSSRENDGTRIPPTAAPAAEEKGEEDVVDCPICMCQVTGDEEAASLDLCIHAFHFTCIVKWGETTNQCPMCKSRFHAVTRLRDDHVKKFRGNRRRRPTGEEDPSITADRPETEDEEEEVEGARAVCLHCGDGGSEEQLMLCDGTGCENGAHTFCCGLEEVPSGDWFCPDCQSRREADARRDAILRRAWAVASGSDDDSNLEGRDAWSSDHPERRRQRPAASTSAGGDDDSVAIDMARVRSRPVADTRYFTSDSGRSASRKRRNGVMNDERVELFERGLVGSCGASEADEDGVEEDGDDDGQSDELGWQGQDEQEDVSSSSSMSAVSAPYLASGTTTARRPRRHRRRPQRPSREDLPGEAKVEEETPPNGNTDYGDAGRLIVRRRARTSSVDNNATSRRPDALISPTTLTRQVSSAVPSRLPRGRPRDGVASVVSSTPSAWRSSTGSTVAGRGRASGANGRSSSSSIVRLSAGGGGGGSAGNARDRDAGDVAGPNLWPRVLASASSVVAPRHEFGEVEEEKDSDEEGEREEGARSVVEQSFADAMLAAQLARGGLNKKKAPPALKARLTQIRRAEARSGSGGSGRRATDGASSTITTTSAAGATVTPGQRNLMSPSSSTSIASTAPPRRSYKRPRMMRTPSTATAGLFLNTASVEIDSENGAGAAAGSSQVPLVRPLVPNSPPSSSRYAGGLGSCGGSSSGGLAIVSPCLPAAPDVRMGQAEVHALVRRLRDVAIAERARRASSTASVAPSGGGRGGGLSRGAEREGQPREQSDSKRRSGRMGEEGDPSSEVVAVMQELRRVAIHGDATTLDVLLSSQLLPALRLWLEPAADGGAFLPSSQRTSLFKVLMALPVQKSHLKDSGLGMVAVAMAADPTETRENRELIKQIIRRWSQLVLHTPRELPVSPFSPNHHVSPKRRACAGSGSSVRGFGSPRSSSTSSRVTTATTTTTTTTTTAVAAGRASATAAAAGNWTASAGSHPASTGRSFLSFGGEGDNDIGSNGESGKRDASYRSPAGGEAKRWAGGASLSLRTPSIATVHHRVSSSNLGSCGSGNNRKPGLFGIPGSSYALGHEASARSRSSIPTASLGREGGGAETGCRATTSSGQIPRKPSRRMDGSDYSSGSSNARRHAEGNIPRLFAAGGSTSGTSGVNTHPTPSASTSGAAVKAMYPTTDAARKPATVGGWVGAGGDGGTVHAISRLVRRRPLNSSPTPPPPPPPPSPPAIVPSFSCDDDREAGPNSISSGGGRNGGEKRRRGLPAVDPISASSLSSPPTERDAIGHGGDLARRLAGRRSSGGVSVAGPSEFSSHGARDARGDAGRGRS